MTVNRKTQIIRTAARMFRERGYNAVSMRDLAEDMGIRAASLYNHITSKEEILGIIIMDVARSFTNHIDETFPGNESSVCKLKEIIQMYIDITINKTDALACMNNDWLSLDENRRREYIRMREDYEVKFRRIILKGMQTGEIEKSDPEIIVFSLLSTLRTFYLWYAKNKEYDRASLQEDISQVLLSGIIRK